MTFYYRNLENMSSASFLIVFSGSYFVFRKTNLYRALLFFYRFFLIYMISISIKAYFKDKIFIILGVEVTFNI